MPGLDPKESELWFQYHSLSIGEQVDFNAPSVPYKCVLLTSAPAPEAWRTQIADWLVGTGCLYVMTWGQGCKNWHDSVDIANLSAFNFCDIPDDRFVMTTWHENETLSDVMHFAKHCTGHPSTIVLETMLVLDIGNTRREEALKRLFERQ